MIMDKELTGVPAAALAVMELFAARAEELRFPGLDAATLTRLGAEVEAASGAVREAELALLRARDNHRALAEQLLDQTRRALAYARVYAEGDEELEQALQSLALSNPQRSPERKPRQAKVKRRTPGATGEDEAGELPFSGSEGEAEASP